MNFIFLLSLTFIIGCDLSSGGGGNYGQQLMIDCHGLTLKCTSEKRVRGYGGLFRYNQDNVTTNTCRCVE